MKQPKFSIEKFNAAKVKTMHAEELNLVLGATAVVAQCSTSSDSDSQCSNCSQQGDKDDQSSIAEF